MTLSKNRKILFRKDLIKALSLRFKALVEIVPTYEHFTLNGAGFGVNEKQTFGLQSIFLREIFKFG